MIQPEMTTMNALCKSKDDLKNVDFALVSEMASVTLTALVLDISDAVSDLSTFKSVLSN